MKLATTNENSISTTISLSSTPSSLSSNLGFLLSEMMNKRTSKHGRHSFCYKNFKWVIWVSVSLYFFTSYLITNSNNKPISLPKTNLSISVSQSLIKETNTKFQQKPTIPSQGFPIDLKIYIYNLPSKYNTDWLSNKRCSNHLFASEVAIHKALLNSDVRTLNPFEADFFYVPVYLSCNFSSVNGFPSLSHAKPLLKSAVDEEISSKMPFWNQSKGSDHIFVASHDYGACFHPMEDVAIEHGIPEFLKNSIMLQTFGVRFRHPCQDVKHILIPPYVSPVNIRSVQRNGKRDIWVYFRGKMEIHPKNINGRIYSRGVRTLIRQKFSRNRKFYLKRHRFDGYLSEIQRSVFCLCPLGWAPWSPRLVESVALGCIPVIIADGIRLPFMKTIQWSKISLTVAERDVGKLGKILEHVANTNLSKIQKYLWDPVNREALLYNEDIQHGDATSQVLYTLAARKPQHHFFD